MTDRPLDLHSPRFTSCEADPYKAFTENVIVAMDLCVAEGIRNYRAGRGDDLRAMGFTETADLLGM